MQICPEFSGNKTLQPDGICRQTSTTDVVEDAFFCFVGCVGGGRFICSTQPAGVVVVGVFLFLPITKKISALVPDTPQFTRMYNEQDMSPFIYIEP